MSKQSAYNFAAMKGTLDSEAMSKKHGGAGVSPKMYLDLIRERKEELKQEMEQKRLHDLKRIQEMKSTDGKDPIEMIPKEIWQTIFDELSPEDRTSTWQVHPLFRHVMENSHVPNNLLPQILKFEVDKFWDNVDPSPVSHQGGDHEKEAKGKVPLALYLELRGLSKILRDRVDLCIEADLLKRLRQGERISEVPRASTMFQLSSVHPDMKMLDGILAFYRENPNSKFVSRSLHVSLELPQGTRMTYTELFEQFKKKVTTFLELVGRQILHFSFFALNYSRVRGSLEAVKLRFPFVEWLKLMPNLMWFQVHLFCFRPLENCVDIEALQGQPFPKLEKLERVDLTLVTFFPQQNDRVVESIPKAILEANPHIKILHMIGKGHNVIPTMELPLLEFFDPGLNHNVGNMKQVMNLKWPLKRLVLCFDLEKNDTINSVFQLLNNYSGLEQLDLKVKDAKIGGDIDFLMLPQLKKLDMEIITPIIDYGVREPFHFFLSLQFLLHSKNLTKLKWTIESREVKRLKGILERIKLPWHIINFRGGWAELGRSNIWQVFPSLGCVRATNKDLGDPRGVVQSVNECRRR